MYYQDFLPQDNPAVMLNSDNFHRRSLISNFEKYTPRPSLEYQMFLAEHPELKNQTVVP